MVKASYESRDGYYRLALDGHADYKAAGEDIVCAGISALVYALMGFLEINRDKTSHQHIEYESGKVRIFAVGNEIIGGAFQMALTGLEMIANGYPKHLSVNITSATGGDTSEQTMRKGQ